MRITYGENNRSTPTRAESLLVLNLIPVLPVRQCTPTLTCVLARKGLPAPCCPSLHQDVLDTSIAPVLPWKSPVPHSMDRCMFQARTSPTTAPFCQLPPPELRPHRMTTLFSLYHPPHMLVQLMCVGITMIVTSTV